MALLVAYLVLVWVDAAPLGNLHTGDTDNLVAGARRAADCIHLGTWTRCGRLEGVPVTEVGPYPLLQYLPSVALVRLGLSDDAIITALGRLNFLAFAGTLVLCVVALAARRGRDGAWGLIALVAVLGSSATYQATSGFGEMLAAFTLVAAVAASAHRRPLLMAAAMALASLGKETQAPFVLVLCLLAARHDDELLPPRRILVALGLGTAGGLAATAAFNVFRFGSLRNLFYLDPMFRTPGLGRQVEYAVGGWLSPVAGIAWFWPLATLLLVVSTVLAVVAAARRRPWPTWLPTLVVVTVVVGFVGGLALWFAPFGWITFGPRLAVPLLPGAVVVVLLTAAPPLGDLARKVVRSPATVVGAALLVAALGWTQYGAPWTHAAAVNQLISADDSCPNMTKLSLQEDPATQFRCTSHVMWRRHSATLDDAALRGGAPALAGRLLAAGATLALTIAALTALREPPRRRRSASAPPQSSTSWSAGQLR